MHLSRWLVLGALLPVGAGRATAQDASPQDSLGARIWLDRGDDAVLDRGDRVRVYYRTSADAYVAIFHIDTDGAVQLLYPQAPDIDYFTQGNKDYQLLFSRSAFWYVDEYPGTGYYFIVASQEPFDFTDFAYSSYERGWDLSQVGRTVYRDPYLAMDDYVASLIPDWKTAPYALDFLSYSVGEREPYPRFLCYNCHEFRSYVDWNPYAYACSTFRVVIWDDPYFSPAYRYDGTRVVFARAAPGRARFSFKERAAGEPWSPLVRRRVAPPRHPVRFSEPVVAPRPTVRAPVRRTTPTTPTSPLRRGTEPVRGRSGAVGSPERGTTSPTRPSTPTRAVQPQGTRGRTETRGGQATQGRGQAVPTQPGRGSSGERPVLERRPTTGGTRSRPSDAARPTRQGGSRGGAKVVTPPTRGSGGSTVIPRRGGGSTTTVPSRGGSSTTTIPRRSGGGSSTRVLPRRGGGGGSSMPTVRSSPTRSPVTRPSTAGSRSRAQPTRRSGGGGGRPATVVRPRSSRSTGGARSQRTSASHRRGRGGGS